MKLVMHITAWVGFALAVAFVFGAGCGVCSRAFMFAWQLVGGP